MNKIELIAKEIKKRREKSNCTFFIYEKVFDKMQMIYYNVIEVKKMKKKKRNNKQKMLLNIKTNKDLNWQDVEVITGYTRQNIDHAFKNGTQKTIEKVLEILESV